MDYQLKEARLKYDREQQEKKDAARRRIEREIRAKEAAEKRRAEVEENQRLRRLKEAERHEVVRFPVYLRTILRNSLFSCTEMPAFVYSPLLHFQLSKWVNSFPSTAILDP